LTEPRYTTPTNAPPPPEHRVPQRRERAGGGGRVAYAVYAAKPHRDQRRSERVDQGREVAQVVGEVFGLVAEGLSLGLAQRVTTDRRRRRGGCGYGDTRAVVLIPSLEVIVSWSQLERHPSGRVELTAGY
jgi:hypothetical protein